ncbi:hypothetical protein N7476_004762 [Penicillium atrosanguineum]|uniref:Zn(2)-C6 fungal-type domain-containing protein n=1 Tax=Penicillium atrosanguineum TaxID=1132637 RepID=A0A9W9U6Z7_9EURO|nr:hypothetical protein N7476_004762 [Penicillium atrosanguineum]
MHDTHATGTSVMTNNAKRYACDRCRDLKLRCPRDFEDAPCQRCLRVDARCITSSGRPLGRPPGPAESNIDGPVNQASYHPQYKRQRFSADPSATNTTTTKVRRVLGASGASGASAVSGFSPTKSTRPSYHPASNPTNHDAPQFENMLDMQLEDIQEQYDLLGPCAFPTSDPGDPAAFFEPPQWSAMARDSLDDTYSNNRDATQPQGMPNLDEVCDYGVGAPDMEPMLDDELYKNKSNHARPGTAGTSSNSRHGFDTCPTPGRPNSDWTMPLINALGGVSRQIEELRMQARDLVSSPVGACTFEGITPSLGFLDTPPDDGPSDSPSLRTKLLGKAVIATMRFILVLQMMAPSPVDWTGFVGDDDSSGAADEARSPPAPGSSVNATPQVTLMVLSTYLLLVELFDIILSPTVPFLDKSARVALDTGEVAEKTAYTPLSPTPSGPQRPSRSPTSAHGIVRPRNQDILMTIRIVEHQLHSLEKVMGLPAQYRLVGRKNEKTNVMCCHEASVLAKAVMQQALQTLLSLKKTLDCIQNTVGASTDP